MTDVMTDAEVLRSRNDVEMIKRPHLWPGRVAGHHVLCLKRTNAQKVAEGDGLPYDYGRLVSTLNQRYVVALIVNGGRARWGGTVRERRGRRGRRVD